MTRFLRRNKAGLGLICIGLLFVAMGVWRGEVEVVLRKAVIICMECIGLG